MHLVVPPNKVATSDLPMVEHEERCRCLCYTSISYPHIFVCGSYFYIWVHNEVPRCWCCTCSSLYPGSPVGEPSAHPVLDVFGTSLSRTKLFQATTPSPRSRGASASSGTWRSARPWRRRKARHFGEATAPQMRPPGPG